jgi:hypothetical protein
MQMLCGSWLLRLGCIYRRTAPFALTARPGCNQRVIQTVLRPQFKRGTAKNYIHNLYRPQRTQWAKVPNKNQFACSTACQNEALATQQSSSIRSTTLQCFCINIVACRNLQQYHSNPTTCPGDYTTQQHKPSSSSQGANCPERQTSHAAAASCPSGNW